ncbi:PhzF family phenazine biosynthesis protein, partial [Bacillus cereus]
MNNSNTSHQKDSFYECILHTYDEHNNMFRRIRQMKDIRVYHVDAFTTEKFGGNAAGVVLDGERLTEDEMQNIAKEL